MDVNIKNKLSIRTILIDGFMLMIGTFIFAVGVNCFLVPFQLSAGGISAIAVVLLEWFNIPLSVTNLVVNAILFIFGYRLLGGVSVVKTLMGILFSSLFLHVTTYLPQYNEDIIIALIAGGVLVGIGIGFTVRIQASTGGGDFAALMLNKVFPHISVANLIWIINCSTIVISGIALGNFTIICYTLICLVIYVKMADIICTNGNYAKKIYIISEKSEEIANVILKDFRRGVTALYGKGMYSNNEKLTLLCVVSPKQLPIVCKKIKSIDSKAFIIASDVISVYGEGFIENDEQ